MNEKINELAMQSGLIHEHMSVGERNDTLRKFEKFAESIIQKCASIVAEQSAYKPEYRIRKYFGVEE
ncbi:hypothetical protein [Flavobacterium sp.]|jgi:hypothetical protein|uniref:hypothetical protein n=1 Tax=Flavobacterium sp. TaxID=239 RepID=UPI0037BECBC4